MHHSKTLLLAGLLSLTASLADAANTFFVAPIGTMPNGTGSQASPFASIEQALKSGQVAGGDTLLLMDGSHGELHLFNRTFTPSVTIRSENGKNGHLNRIYMRGTASGFTFRDLTIYPPDSATYDQIVRSDPGSSNVILDSLEIRSRKDVSDRLNWSASTWSTYDRDGILLQSTNSAIMNNIVTVVRHGISSSGANSVVTNNRVIDFSGDGMRAVDGNLVRDNYIANAFAVSGNHDDGFQAWAGPSGVLKDLTVTNNIILEWTYAPGHPLRAQLQGIGLFDGPYDNLIISNNIVSGRAPHGIMAAGVRGGMITNNTVVQADGANHFNYPWVGVSSTKTGIPSQSVVVANNIAPAMSGGPNATNNVVYSGNAVIVDHVATFVDFAGFDFTPAPSTTLIDSAIAAHAPNVDVFNNPRPFGNGPDKGAVEAGSTGGSVTSSTTTTTTTTTSTPTTGSTASTTTGDDGSGGGSTDGSTDGSDDGSTDGGSTDGSGSETTMLDGETSLDITTRPKPGGKRSSQGDSNGTLAKWLRPPSSSD